MKYKLNFSVLYRVITIVLLSGIATGLILFKPTPAVERVFNDENDISTAADYIDIGIDSLYQLFSIEPKNIRKREISISGSVIPRRDHRVQVPPTFVALLFNQKLNLFAGQYGAKVFGSENTAKKIIKIYTQIGKDTTHSISFVPLIEKATKKARTNKRK